MAKATGWAESADAMNERHPAPSAADAEWADAIVFGTPTRFGSVSSEFKAYIDSLGGLWVQGKLNGKAGAVFCSTSADASLYKVGTPYGTSSVSNNQASPPSADDLEVARFQGRQVTDVAKALKHSGVK